MLVLFAQPQLLPTQARLSSVHLSLPQSEAANSSSNSGASSGAGGVDATGHVALCITEELWALSGMDGVSDLVVSLAKVLASLPLPEDDQVRQTAARQPVLVCVLWTDEGGRRVARVPASVCVCVMLSLLCTLQQ